MRDLWKGASLALDVFEDEVKSGTISVKLGGEDEENCDESDVIFGQLSSLKVLQRGRLNPTWPKLLG